MMHDVVSFFERDRPDREFDRPERDDGDALQDESRWIDLHRRRLTTPVTRPSLADWQVVAAKGAKAVAEASAELLEVTRREERRKAAEKADADRHRRTPRRPHRSAVAAARVEIKVEAKLDPIVRPAPTRIPSQDYTTRIDLARAAPFLPDGYGGRDVVLVAHQGGLIGSDGYATARTMFLQPAMIHAVTVVIKVAGQRHEMPLTHLLGGPWWFRGTGSAVDVHATLLIDRAAMRQILRPDGYFVRPPSDWGWVEIKLGGFR